MGEEPLKGSGRCSLDFSFVCSPHLRKSQFYEGSPAQGPCANVRPHALSLHSPHREPRPSPYNVSYASENALCICSGPINDRQRNFQEQLQQRVKRNVTTLIYQGLRRTAQ